MAKVGDAALGIKLKKPIGTTPPLTEYDPKYLERKAELGEKKFALKTGRTLAYWTEGSKDDPAVLCLHGIGQCKSDFIFPAPLPGIYLISVDRIGHGSSSPHEGPPDFTQILAEYIELMDELGVDKFFATGHSYGAMSSVQLASAYPDRVSGIAPIAGPCFPWGIEDKKERVLCDTTPGKMLLCVNNPGCYGGFARSLVGAISSASYCEDKTKDYGMAGQYSMYKTADIGGDKRAWDAMDKDPFFVTKMLDGKLFGNNTKKNMLWEWQTMFRKEGFPYDPKKVKCPTFIYNGKKEATHIANAQVYNRLIEGSQLTIFDEHGHLDIGMMYEKIIPALVKGELVKPNY
jgi:pimeloyl-ACP methyl ester carboxylesterase